MQFVRTMMLTAGLFACASVAHGSPPTAASTQTDAGKKPITKASWFEMFLAQVTGPAKLNAAPTPVTNNNKVARCQACEPAVVRGTAPASTQAVKPAVAIQASEQGRDACTDWGCIRLPSVSEIAAALQMMRDQVSGPGLKPFFHLPTPIPGEAKDVKPVTVVRVPGDPHSMFLPPPPPFPIVREMMPIVTPQLAMPMHHRMVPIAMPAKHVHLATPDLEAHCERMTHRGDVVILEGDVKLHCKKHGQNIRIEAQRVVLNMKDGTFTVESDVASARSTARMVMPPMSEMRQMQWIPPYPVMPMMPPPFPFSPYGPYPIQQIP